MLEKPSLRNLTEAGYGRPKAAQNKFLQTLGTPHVESFDYLLDKGLNQIVQGLSPESFQWNNTEITLKINEAHIERPQVPTSLIGVKEGLVWPSECRQRGSTYSGNLMITLLWSVNGNEHLIQRDLGSVPVMLKSKICQLRGIGPEELVQRGEHEDEWGGYFIVKGKEKLVRMLVVTRRNYPIAIKRPTWKNRGDQFSDLGVFIRSVRKDHTSLNNVIHFVNDGSVRLMFSYKKALYYAPLMLIVKCLVDATDESIFKAFIAGYEGILYYKRCLMHMLRIIHFEGIHSSEGARKFFGKTFKFKLAYNLPPNSSDEDVCDFIFKNCIFIHLDSNIDKYNLLTMMTQKLFNVVCGKSAVEGMDPVMMQELLLGGHLYLQILKEKLQNWLVGVKLTLLRRDAKIFASLTLDEMNHVLRRAGGVGAALENFLSTGNISSKSGLGLQQDKGLVIIAENINRTRYMSHFRAVHRGAFFKDMRTTDARQLLPDAWGFICPVHTPDGAPCGLLNHLTKEAQVICEAEENILKEMEGLLMSLGMQPVTFLPLILMQDCYLTMLDGRLIGHVPDTIIHKLVQKLRILKVQGEKVPKTLEIVLVPKKDYCSQHPGLFLLSGPGRVMRPVLNLQANQVELIGTFEQVYLDIAITPEEVYDNLTTHLELSKTNFLSNLANLIPMPDCNQSPRNMYQCQMSKQTMGTPCLNWHYQSESKLYWLQTPTSPLFRPVHYDHINLDDFPMGTNAIVAVISYTGYDMEDAMIINKSSLERGFAFGSVVKTIFVDLKSTNSYFGLDPSNPFLKEHLGDDGLPFPGQKLLLGQPYSCHFDYNTSKFVIEKYTSSEVAVVANVKLCGRFPNTKDGITGRAAITIRIPRVPSVGDKFASRAGQKGILSQTWPTEDLPFTESGLVPDIVFNPHGFPSRMTIAMMIECMAGKSGAIHGLVHDATPFKFSEEDTAIDYFGKLLQAGGYNYYGTETMYSGIFGTEMKASIFFGIVHYQRLRHMVLDKWQVRSTGPIDSLTRQPVKGRKRGGGVRFGEMERDSLISHGAAFLLQDRLFHCSDKTPALICRHCGTILGPIFAENYNSEGQIISEYLTCKLCSSEAVIDKIDIPYILRYLIVQLASVNIKLKINLEGS